MKQEVRTKEAQCKEKEQFYDSVLQSNHDHEELIKHTERTGIRVRAEFQESEKLLNQFVSDVSIILQTTFYS